MNAVGVDVNTASAPLLRRVSGISPGSPPRSSATATSTGRSRRAPRCARCRAWAPKAFEQSAGFLRISGGARPARRVGGAPGVVPGGAPHRGVDRPRRRGRSSATPPCSRAWTPTRSPTSASGARPSSTSSPSWTSPGATRAPSSRTAAFAEGVEAITDLTPGMVLEGEVTNVAAFGAFVDVGVHQDGLVHISAMSKDFVSDPRSVVGPGERYGRASSPQLQRGPSARPQGRCRLEQRFQRKPHAGRGQHRGWGSHRLRVHSRRPARLPCLRFSG